LFFVCRFVVGEKIYREEVEEVFMLCFFYFLSFFDFAVKKTGIIFTRRVPLRKGLEGFSHGAGPPKVAKRRGRSGSGAPESPVFCVCAKNAPL
jgi:hypothetical protein